MARIPEQTIERIKTEVSLVRLAERYGVALTKQGKDRVGRCPFHDDREPSLVVSESKNLFHCFGCEAAGTPIDWVMRIEGFSFRHAVEVLQQDAAAGAPRPVKRATRRKLDVPFERDADDQTLLNRVIDFYHRTLLQSPDALAYLDKRGLNDPDLINRFQLGFANRTLAYRLPEKQNQTGKALRERLQRLGVLRESGHEHFNGSLVIPILDVEGNAVQAYGRKIGAHLRKGTPHHLYLPGPHRGVFNLDGCRDTDELILCESLIDALTFYKAGYRNVTAGYGVNGVTDELLQAIKAHAIARVLIAYDRDEAGDTAAAKLAERLIGEGFECYRLHFPKGMDANAYALDVTPADKSLGVVIRSAEWMGGAGDTPAPRPKTENATEQKPKAKAQFEQQLKAVSEQMQAVNTDEPLPAKAVPDAPKDIDAEVTDHEINIAFGSRHYRVRGVEHNSGCQTMKINLLVRCSESLHVDTFDLYHAKARNHFIRAAAEELAVDEQVIKTDLGKLLLKLELLQDERRREAEQPEDTVQLSDSEHAEAMDLLKQPDLLNRIVHDIEQIGLVGEATNSLVGYLACVSRRLDKPLAILVQSTSAAGKSSLMDAVLALMPDEERVQYSAMTGQSLFYMGETNLKHKILAIAEEEGVAQASYALKLLQSEGELTIASTAKDPQSGRLETQEYRVEGPVMLFLTTTAIDNDEELLNRCLVLSVNESREQTRTIHRAQRHRRTLDGFLKQVDRSHLLKLHRNAQRLLRPLVVINPYADHLTFVDDKTRTRRDQEKYLTLIDCIALLHQHQREIKTAERRGALYEYIEVELSDIEIANRLAHEVLGRTLDELPPQTRTLLTLLYQMVSESCQAENIAQSDHRFTRRQVRAYTAWSDTQLRVHLDRLVSLEYLLVHRGGRGQSYVYELLYDGQGEYGRPFMLGLIDVAALKDNATTPTSRGSSADPAGASRPQRGAGAGGSRGQQNGKKQNGSVTYDHTADLAAQSASTVQENPVSYAAVGHGES